MKGSLATSTVLHVLVLGFALSSFSAPRTLEVADVEALPVSIVPIEEITQIQQGEKTAPLAEIAAPIPTARPDPVPDAQNAGENAVDLKSSKSAKPSPQEVVSEAPPKPAEKPAPVPEPAPKAPEPPKTAEAEPTPAPAPEKPAEPTPAPEEVAALPAETAPDPVAEAITEAAPAKPEFAALPSVGPVPQARPEPPKETAKAPAKPATQETASTKESDFNADEVAALLNKQDAKGGGAKRSTETASLGGSRTTRGNTLSQSEMDALRGQIQRNWNIIPGMADGGDVRVTVTMKLDPSGNIVGQPDVVATGGSEGVRRTLSGSARRAVLKSQPYQLPQEKYDSWAEVVVNFDPSQMF